MEMQRFIAELERAEVIGPSETDFAKNAEIAARTISVNLSKLPELHYGNMKLQNMRFFQQFGEVKSIRSRDCHRGGNAIYHFIEFKDAQVAAKLLSKHEIEMNHAVIKIEPVKIRNNQLMADPSMEAISENNIEEKYQTSQAPGLESPNNILNALNDDCLRMIFKYSSFSSLCSIANVCVRFSEIAKQVFSSKYKKTIKTSDLKWNNKINSSNIVASICRFGPSIESLQIHPYDFNVNRYEQFQLASHFWKLINKYCSNLTHLDIWIWDLDYETLAEIRPLLLRLKVLSVDCIGPKMLLLDNLISACSQLEVLAIRTAPHNNQINLPSILLPKLIEFKFRDKVAGRFPIEKFLLSNPHLEKIEIENDLVSDNLCRFIGQNMSMLQELTINLPLTWRNRSTTPFHQLKYLKNLKLNLRSYDLDVTSLVQPSLTNNISIEEFRSTECVDRNSIDNICQLKSLKILDIKFLNLSPVTDDSYLIDLARNLPNLENLRIKLPYTFELKIEMIIKMLKHANRLSELNFRSYNDFVFCDENDYNAISEVVRKRTERRRLKIKIEVTNTAYCMCPTTPDTFATKLTNLSMEPDLLVFEQELSYNWHSCVELKRTI